MENTEKNNKQKKYSTSQMFLNSKIFYIFFKECSSAHQACIYFIQIQQKQ